MTTRILLFKPSTAPPEISPLASKVRELAGSAPQPSAAGAKANIITAIRRSKAARPDPGECWPNTLPNWEWTAAAIVSGPKGDPAKLAWRRTANFHRERDCLAVLGSYNQLLVVEVAEPFSELGSGSALCADFLRFSNRRRS